MAKEKIVGIDLGTTKSAISIVEGGKPEVISNAEGERVTPSAVAFTETGERLVGTLAKRQAIINPERTVLEIKRKMGTDHKVKIKSDGQAKEYPPEEISSMILAKLKKDAEDKLGHKLQKAVITVPAYFDNNQRQSTKDAGKIAGLDVVKIINEPTAAALAYGLNKAGDQRILVYDLGGGTFDVSILDIGEGVFEVVATSGDTFLGGKDLDQRVMDWLAQEFKQESGIDLSKDPAAMQRLKDAAEAAKKELSYKNETTINLPYIAADSKGPRHLERRLTRAKFEAMVEDLLQRSIQICKQALQDAKMTPADIQQVVMVGGSTRQPRVQDLVADLFGKAKINKEINPDEVVSLGAAIEGGVLAGELGEVVLLDVVPLTLSIETLGGIATPLIERNTTYPCEKTKTFTTAEDGQSSVEIHIAQGERKLSKDNRSLGRFMLMGIPPAPRGVPQIDVTFAIDGDGILNVTAKDRATGKSSGIVIKESSRLGEGELKRMQEDARKFEEEDRKRVEEIETRNEADHLVYNTEKMLSELGAKASADLRARVEEKVRSLKKKIEEGAAAAELRQGIQELREISMELGKELYQSAGSAAGPDAETQGPTGAQSESPKGGPEKFVDAEYEKDDRKGK